MTALVPFTDSALHQTIHEALWGREFDPRLVDALIDEAEKVAEMFCPAAGYLTTDDQLDDIVSEAVQSILRSVRSTVEHAFTRGLQRVPPPEFVAPSRGSWVAERRSWRKGIEVGTWHRSSGRTQPRPGPRAGGWPSLITSCGRRLDAWWNDDGTPSVDWLVVPDEPLVACGHCHRISLREAVAA